MGGGDKKSHAGPFYVHKIEDAYLNISYWEVINNKTGNPVVSSSSYDDAHELATLLNDSVSLTRKIKSEFLQE